VDKVTQRRTEGSPETRGAMVEKCNTLRSQETGLLGSGGKGILHQEKKKRAILGKLLLKASPKKAQQLKMARGQATGGHVQWEQSTKITVGGGYEKRERICPLSWNRRGQSCLQEGKKGRVLSVTREKRE